MLSKSLGKAITEAQRRRWVNLLVDALALTNPQPDVVPAPRSPGAALGLGGRTSVSRLRPHAAVSIMGSHRAGLGVMSC
jgi:hypothetical protein